MAIQTTATPQAIALFVPNLIGYFRIASALVSYVLAFTHPVWFLALYTLSFALDAADGYAARALNQATRFGAILDMATDRAATSALVVIISHTVGPLDRVSILVASSLVFLDIISHFTRMYMSLISRRTSHKDTANTLFSLLKLYYSNRTFMGALCIGQECFYLGYYLQHHFPSPTLFGLNWFVLAPLCFLKQVANVQQFIDALYQIAVADAELRNADASK